MLYNYLIIILSSSFMFAQVDVINMGEGEEAPAEETAPAEEAAPAEETAPVDEEVPSEEEMPSASDDSELTEDIPINFKDEYVISLNLGMPVMIGENLDYRFDPGLSINLGITTPFGFNLMNKDVAVSGSFSMHNLSANDAYSNFTAYAPMNIGVNLSTDLMFFDLSLGTGLAIASGTWNVLYDGTKEEYSMTSLYTSFGLSYTLPLESLLENAGALSNLQISLGGGYTMIMGAPDESGDTSDLINVGMSLGYPVLF